MHFIGYIGLTALAAGWIPQTFQTIKEKDCKANMQFLILSFIGSFALMLYAVFLGDAIFSLLNGMTSLGAIINLYYKFKAAGRKI